MSKEGELPFGKQLSRAPNATHNWHEQVGGNCGHVVGQDRIAVEVDRRRGLRRRGMMRIIDVLSDTVQAPIVNWIHLCV